MTRYRDQLAAALAAVRITGSTGYAWLGLPSPRLQARLAAGLDARERRDYLVSILTAELYRSFYRHGTPVPSRRDEPDPIAGDPVLARALSGANTGRGNWEPGWTVSRVDGDYAVVAAGGLRTRVAPGEWRGHAGGMASVRLPKELPELSPGFFMIVGDAPGTLSTTVRVYWNVTARSAAALVRQLTACLNARGVPFRLKIADHPVRFDRCDAAILYLPADAFGGVRDALRDVGIALDLDTARPAFTLELAPGVGLAEDDNGESFGVRRCAQVADGLVRAHELGARTGAARLAVVADRLAEDGVLLDAPYLDSGLDGRHVL